MSSSEERNNKIVFYNKGGRPKELTKKESYKAQLKAKRKWRKFNKERISLYNEMYRNKESKKRKGSKRNSRKGSQVVKVVKTSKKHSRKGSRKHSKKGSRKHSKKETYKGHTVKLLKINPDGSRIVLIK